MLEILIPTYNRQAELVKNIVHMNDLVCKENLEGKIRLIVSDNASTDNTSVEIKKIIPEVSFDIVHYKQDKNIGLENNAVFVLRQATTDYIVFLGDDDYLPEGYLSKLVEITENQEFGVVIPGFSALMPGGDIKPGRRDMRQREHEPGFNALYDFSNFGHQLSGLFFRREGVVEAYLDDEENRNIYLFIFFICYGLKKYKSTYLPEYQVLVTQGGAKDWSYDQSGLLTEIFKNFRATYPQSAVKRFWLCFAMMRNQSWRLRVGINPLLAAKAMLHLMVSSSVDVLVKISLPVLVPYFYFTTLSSLIKRKVL